MLTDSPTLTPMPPGSKPTAPGWYIVLIAGEPRLVEYNPAWGYPVVAGGEANGRHMGEVARWLWQLPAEALEVSDG